MFFGNYFIRYYDGWDQYSKYADYYNKGSRIALDGVGLYYIITHHQHYDRAVMGNYTDRNYYVKVKSATAEGSPGSTYKYDREDIYDIVFDGTNIIAFYKTGNKVFSSKLTVGVDNKITFSDIEEVTSPISNTNLIPATLVGLPTTRVIGGISGGKVFTKYGAVEEVSDKTVKASTVVVATQCGGNIYTAYTGSADGLIRLIKREE